MSSDHGPKLHHLNSSSADPLPQPAGEIVRPFWSTEMLDSHRYDPESVGSTDDPPSLTLLNDRIGNPGPPAYRFPN